MLTTQHGINCLILQIYKNSSVVVVFYIFAANPVDG